MDENLMIPTGECSAGDKGIPLAPSEALARTLAQVTPVVQSEPIELAIANGRVLAEAPLASTSVPPFGNSAMDGYAINTDDLNGIGPWTLPVIGTLAAGGLAGPVYKGRSALRIFTGAALPSGFDAVVMQERCERKGDDVTIFERPRSGRNIRGAGEDVCKGQVLLGAGEVLTPERLTLLAGAGIAHIQAFRRLKVAVVCTGSELRSVGEQLEPGLIYNSNGILVNSTLRSRAWIDVTDLGIVRDDRQMLADILRKASMDYDVVITTGGVSAGDEDHVAAAVRECGGFLNVMKVAMRPGKPVKIGRLGGALFAGLPGNPNAALTCLRYIVLPALRKMAAICDFETKWCPAVAAAAYPNKPDRTEFVPFRTVSRDSTGLPRVEFLGNGSSANLSAIAMAEGIARLTGDAGTIEPDMRLEVCYFASD